MLAQRLIFGTILIALLLGGAWLDAHLDGLATPAFLSGLVRGDTLPPGIVVLPVLALLGWVASGELAVILRGTSVQASGMLMRCAALAGLLSVSLGLGLGAADEGAALVATAAALVMAGSMLWSSRDGDPSGAAASAGGALLGFVYLGVLPGFLVLVRADQGMWVLAWLLIVTKSSDIGAFAAGKSLGRRKLIPWLSPGKTWEGLGGGIALAALLGAALAPLAAALGGGFPDPGGLGVALTGAIVGALLAVLGQAGDLSASLLKRDAAIKDAGRSMPGFGGVIDVIDSLLLVGPFAFWLLGAASAD
ncbi:MAG: phosphatidate cytidylyltransferase [Planctomycetota bacterium]